MLTRPLAATGLCRWFLGLGAVAALMCPRPAHARRHFPTRSEIAGRLAADHRPARLDEEPPLNHFLYDALTMWQVRALYTEELPRESPWGKQFYPRRVMATAASRVLAKFALARGQGTVRQLRQPESVLRGTVLAARELAPELRTMGYMDGSLAEALAGLREFRGKPVPRRAGGAGPTLVPALLSGAPDSPDAAEAVKRLEVLIDAWRPTPADTASLVPRSLVRDVSPLGTWSWVGAAGLTSSGFSISPGAQGSLRVAFSTGGCLGSWRLQRTARYSDGVLELDRPVHEYIGSTYQRLYTLRLGGQVQLVPARAVPTAEGWDAGRPEFRLRSERRKWRAGPPRFFTRVHPWRPGDGAPERAGPAVEGDPIRLFKEPGAHPDEPVPQNHFVYDDLTAAARSGFDLGFPDGTFSGERPVTRGEFATAVRTALAQLDWMEAVGAPWPAHDRYYPQLHRTTLEFDAELLAQGADRDQIRARQERLDALWWDPSPRGVRTPGLEEQRPEPAHALLCDDPAAEATGERLASEEWSRGEIVLYTTGAAPRDNPRLAAAIPVRRASGGEPAYSRQVMLAHNRAVWARLRAGGAPGASPLGWITTVFSLRRAWRSAAPVRWAPDPEVLDSPDGCFQLRWTTAPESRGWLTVRSSSGDRKVTLPAHPKEVVWGPRGSAAVFLRFAAGGKSLYFAVDLRTGWVLNAEATGGWGGAEARPRTGTPRQSGGGPRGGPGLFAPGSVGRPVGWLEVPPGV
jgi:hypothetical protein